MKIVSDLLITALFTVFVQNLVLSSGLGMSEAIRVSKKPGTFGKIAVMISGFSVITSVICSLLNNKALSLKTLPFAGKAAVYGGILAGVYIFVALLLKLIFRVSDKLLGTLGIAALNTLVFAVPFINDSAAYSFVFAVGSGIGAGIAFVLAAALISKGSAALEKNKNIPEAFRGTPAMLIYVGLLSLAFAGFAGTSLFA
ncbi:MAG: hypothetical protein J6J45_02940 [Clostridia bacterium]|nr:hypothetical protein [Clostridia bacterium]